MALAQNRKDRSKKKISGTDRHIMIISKSSAQISAQVMNPKTGFTLLGSSSNKITTGTKIEKATQVGQALAESLKSHKINTLVVNRNGYVYHGRVKALIESVRNHGITI